MAAATAPDAESLREELDMVKEKAKAYINRLNEEKASLSKELQDKTTLLAGVKDKTKAYVEKLKAEEAAAISAVEDQVKDRDDRLARAKEMLQTRLASKDAELAAVKEEAHILRRKLEQDVHDASKPNGAAGGAASGMGEAGNSASEALSEELATVREELQHAKKAVDSVEESKAGVEMQLAEFKKAAQHAEEQLAEATHERDAVLRERDAARAETKDLRQSLLKAEESVEIAEEIAKGQVEQEKNSRLAAVTDGDRLAKEHKEAVELLKEQLAKTQAKAQADAAASEKAMGEVRSQLGVAVNDKKAAEVASETAQKTVSDAEETALKVRQEAEEQAAQVTKALAIAEAEVERLRGQLQEARTAAATASIGKEEEREAQAHDDVVESLREEVAELKEKLRVAEETAAAKESAGAEKRGDPDATALDASTVHDSNGRKSDGETSGAGEDSAEDADVEPPSIRQTAELVERIATLETELTETRKTHPEPLLVADRTTTSKTKSAAAIKSHTADTGAGDEELEVAVARTAALEEELAGVKLALYEAEEAAATKQAAASEDTRALEEARSSLEEARANATSTSSRADALEKELVALKLTLHEVEEAASSASAELARTKEALRATETEASKAQEGAGSQAEELSARLMGALEEREEGRRREAAGRKEAERLQKELVKAVAEAVSARGEAKDAATKAEGRVKELEEKVKEAEKQAEESEAGAVGVVESMEEALTKGERDVKRLKDEATGLRKEVSIAKAELEARGEALRQAKLDLASAVEEASNAGSKAAELRSKLDAATAEHTEAKMKLQSESAANSRLKAAVLETNETVSKRVDGMREAIEKAEAERDTCKSDWASSKSQVQALQAQVASLLRKHEGAKTEAGLRAGDLQQRLSEAQALLTREREGFAERKREMQVYAEAMAKEGDAMRGAVTQAQNAAARAAASEVEARSSLAQVNQRAEAMVLSLRQTLDRQRAEAEQKHAAVEERNETLEAETSRLQHLLAQETGQSEEKTQGLEHSLLDKIEEANLHKKKRLAARSEMISLAKTLEAERDGHKAVGHALQYGLVPKAIEQATVLEHVVMTAERSVHSLSRASGVRLATNIQAAQASLARLRGRVAGADDPSPALHQRQFPDLSRVALMGSGGVNSPKDLTGSVLSDRLDSPLGSTISSEQTGSGFWQADGRRSSGRLLNDNSASSKDSVYLDRVRRLENEMERVSSGLALVSQSVDQLSELVQVQAGLCGGFSFLCCSSRRSGGGPAYTTLEMSNRVEGAEQIEGLGRDRGASTGLAPR